MFSTMTNIFLMAVAVAIFQTSPAYARASPLFTSRLSPSYDQQNSLSPTGRYGGGPVNWVQAELRTGQEVTAVQGERVQLECVASGSPSPSIQWFKGSRPITPVQAYVENNDIPPVTRIGVGKVVSKYVIDCAQRAHQGAYTCLAYSGGEVAVSQPTEVIVQGNMLSTCDRDESKPPQVILSRPTALESSKNDVVLPCAAHGRPTPNIFWLDKDDKVIDSKNDSRFQVLDSGALLISRISWADMGGYTCVAENKLGRDYAKTFLYPFKSDSNEEGSIQNL